MIKVNLLKEGTRTQTSATQTAMTGTNFSVNSELRKKLVIFALPIITAFTYNTYNIVSYENQFDSLDTKLTDLKTQTTAMKPEIDEVTHYIDEKKKLSEQIELLKGLSLKRYRTLKIFDAVQNLIPSKAWLMKLDIQEEQVTIEGHASEDIAISSFMEALEQSLYFKDVTWIDSREVKQDKGDVVKFFKIKLALEKL